MKNYNIYTGLYTDFAKIQYAFTTLCNNINEAFNIAFKYADSDYKEIYAGHPKFPSYDDIVKKYCNEHNLDYISMEDQDKIDDLYLCIRLSKINYYAISTEKDTNVDPSDIIYDYITEDGGFSKIDRK